MDKNITKGELERRSQDRILVHNVLDIDWIERWGGIPFIVPAYNKDNGRGLGNAILPRYIAENYIKHILDKIMGDKLIKAINERNEVLKGKGEAQMEKWIGGQEETFAMQLTANRPQEIRDLIPQLWIRTDEEYGMMEQVAQIENKPEVKDINDILYDVVDKKVEAPINPPVGSGTPAPSIPEAKIEQAKQNIINQVS